MRGRCCRLLQSLLEGRCSGIASQTIGIHDRHISHQSATSNHEPRDKPSTIYHKSERLKDVRDIDAG